jgi:hypothetical protein
MVPRNWTFQKHRCHALKNTKRRYDLNLHMGFDSSIASELLIKLRLQKKSLVADLLEKCDENIQQSLMSFRQKPRLPQIPSRNQSNKHRTAKPIVNSKSVAVFRMLGVNSRCAKSFEGSMTHGRISAENASHG